MRRRGDGHGARWAGTVLLLAGAGLLAGEGAAGAGALPCNTFQQVATPNYGPSDNDFWALGAAGPDDLWAVGTYRYQNAKHTLTAHWDSTTWTQVASPSPASGSELYGVGATGPADVWAAGYVYDGTADRTLVEHWDGIAWSVVASPSVGVGDDFLNAVAALSPRDAWAVGRANDGTADQTLVEHWDGTAWSVVAAPSPGSSLNTLTGVAAVAVDDTWAVGYTASGTVRQTLVEHWDGTAWRVVPSPSPGASDNFLGAVAAAGPDDAWAVGGYVDGGSVQPLVLHWDGTAWMALPGPPGVDPAFFSAAAAAGPGDAWFAGERETNPVTPLAAHWTGGAWIVANGPDVGAETTELLGVAIPAPGAVWVAGRYFTGAVDQTLAARYTGACPPPTATATPPASPTPAPGATPPPSPSAPAATPTATATGVPSPSPTATATPAPPSPSRTPAPSVTATPCGLAFSDVQPADYFYGPVLHLACRGVLSGYADGTFRPYNPTTRAQMVKIVILGFGRPIVTPPAGGPTFADVPPAQPFYAVVETAAAAGIVSGYACGGLGEPCDAARRPYFRPYVSVTRGQLAKIVVVAAGWPPINPPAPAFADVPPGSAFYPYVETAACRGVISGYGDGTFRPGAGATRGQIAKIEYLALTSARACETPTPLPPR